jgi:hypothetical protein
MKHGVGSLGRSADEQEHIFMRLHTWLASIIAFPIYFCFSFFIAANGYWFNDDEALERSGRLGQPIAAALPDGVPPGRVGLRVSRDLVGCLAYHVSGEAPPATCLAYRAHRWRHQVMCSCVNTFLGDGRLESRLG